MKYENYFKLHACDSLGHYSPKAAKRTRAAKRKATMEANLAMITIFILKSLLYICV